MTQWLLVSGDFTPLGGMDAANLALARYLATRNSVHLVTHRAWAELLDTPNVSIHQVRRPFGSNSLGEPLLDQAGRAWANRLPGGRVVVNGGNCRWHDISWIHYVHAAFAPTPTGSLVRRVKSRIVRSVDRSRELRVRSCKWVVCNSHRTARDVIEKIGVRAERVRVVYYGTDPKSLARVRPAQRREAKSAIGWPAHRPVVAFVGAMGDRRKGFDTLFSAWSMLCSDTRWDVDLAVIGSGNELAVWVEQARRTGLAERIRFLGFRTDVPAVLAACDALVHPARYEAFGLGVHEAICRGLPALVSAHAGIAELYPPDLASLLLTAPEDPVAVARALMEWRRDSEFLDAAVAPFADRLLARTWEHMADEFVRVVSEPSTDV